MVIFYSYVKLPDDRFAGKCKINLVAGDRNPNVMFPETVGNFIIPTDEVIVVRGGESTNQ